MKIFAAVFLGLGIVDALLLVSLAWRRVRLAWRSRSREQIKAGLKTAILAFVDGERELPAALTVPEQEVMADVLAAYARRLRGSARERITVYFEQQGAVDREVAALERGRAPSRRATAAHRLGEMGSVAATVGLIAALEDSDRDVRAAAARSLGKLRDPSGVEPLLATVVDGRVPLAVVGWALLKIGQPALPRLRLSLDAEEAAHRAGAVRMLGLLGDIAHSDEVAECLRDSSALVRAAAARSLERIGGPRHFGPLVAAIDDRVPAVRAAAAAALGRLHDRRALLTLFAHARDDQFEVARAAAHAAAAIDLDATATAAAVTEAPHLREAVDLARLG